MCGKKISCCGDDVCFEIKPTDDGVTVRVKGANPRQVARIKRMSSNICDPGCCDDGATGDTGKVENEVKAEQVGQVEKTSCCIIRCQSTCEPCTDC